MSEVVVIGGANMDLHARSDAPVVLGSSNPGRGTLSPGGVARNIAESLARLGTTAALVAVVGDDPVGDDVLAATADAGVDLSHVRRRHVRTGTYNAILDNTGELVVAVADMAATEQLSPLAVEAARDVIGSAKMLVVDGNVPPGSAARALEIAYAAGVPVLLEPVSVPKATGLRDRLDADHPVFAVTPNLGELGALTGLSTDGDDEVAEAAAQLHERGAELVWVRRGRDGSWLSGPDGQTRIPAVPVDVVSVTGAGDAMVAGFCHALLDGAGPAEAARFGAAAAAVTCASERTVRPDLTDELVRSLL